MFNPKVVWNFYVLMLLTCFACWVKGEIVFNSDNAKRLNSTCIIKNSGLPGICVPIEKCTNAQATLRNHKINPTICYFDQSNPVVCCSDVTNDELYNFNNCRKNIIQCHKSPENTDFFLTECWETECKKTTNEFSYKFSTCNPLFATNALPTKIGDFPFMAALGWKQSDGEISFNCGGFLLTRNFVVTAAHCTDLGGDAPSVVRTGGIDLDNNTKIELDIPIHDIYNHPLYKKTEAYNDIALIKLSKDSSDIPRCLSDSGIYNIEGISTTFIGYGQTSFAGPSSNKLLQIELTVITNEQCKKHYPPSEYLPYGLIDSQICAVDTKKDSNQDTCQGDSGGPLLTGDNKSPKLFGVTSFGQSCGSKAPGVYTKILYYLDWIESIVWPNV